MLIKILLVIAILIQTVATAYALKLVRATKYNSVWILFIVGFSLLSVERIVQLLMAADCRCWNIWTSLFNSSGKEGLLYGNQNHYQRYVRRNTYGSD